MRVIDLLVKIANGEEVPERIKYDTKEMKYDHNKQDYLGYYSNGNGEWLFQYLFDRCKNTEHFINDKVEIIEEDPEDEEIVEWSNIAIREMKKAKNLSEIKAYIETIMRTQNEIIEKIETLD